MGTTEGSPGEQNAHQGHSYSSPNLLCISPAMLKTKQQNTQKETSGQFYTHSHTCSKPGMATEIRSFCKRRSWSHSDFQILFKKAWRIPISKFPWLEHNEIFWTLWGIPFSKKKWLQAWKGIFFFFKYCLKALCCIWSKGWFHSWNIFLFLSCCSGESFSSTPKRKLDWVTACKLPLLIKTTFSSQSTLFLYHGIEDKTLDSAFKAPVNEVAKVKLQ